MKITLSGKFLKGLMLFVEKDEGRLLDGIIFNNKGYIMTTDGATLARISCPVLKNLNKTIIVRKFKTLTINNKRKYTFDLTDIENVTISDGNAIYKTESEEKIIDANELYSNYDDLPLILEDISFTAKNSFCLDPNLLKRFCEFAKLTNSCMVINPPDKNRDYTFITFPFAPNNDFVINEEVTEFKDEYLNYTTLMVMGIRISSEKLRPTKEQVNID